MNEVLDANDCNVLSDEQQQFILEQLEKIMNDVKDIKVTLKKYDDLAEDIDNFALQKSKRMFD